MPGTEVHGESLCPGHSGGTDGESICLDEACCDQWHRSLIHVSQLRGGGKEESLDKPGNGLGGFKNELLSHPPVHSLGLGPVT